MMMKQTNSISAMRFAMYLHMCFMAIALSFAPSYYSLIKNSSPEKSSRYQRKFSIKEQYLGINTHGRPAPEFPARAAQCSL